MISQVRKGPADDDKGLLRQPLYWWRHERTLSSMTEMDQFRDYVMRVNPKSSCITRVFLLGKREFLSVVSALGLNLRNINFLDLGTGYGDSLDICHEQGARGIDFVEVDLFFRTIG